MHTCDALPPPGHPRGTADDARIRATYDAVAGEYHRQLAGELAAKPLDRALLGAVCELAAGGTLADVGCGPGHVTRFLADHHPDVVGVDLSPAMVALAREQAPGLRFVEASMLELPVPDDAWAGAVALYSVIHLDARGRAAAFAELAACCGGAGCFTVHVRRVGALDELYAAEAADLLRELVATGPALGWVDPPPVEEVRALLAQIQADAVATAGLRHAGRRGSFAATPGAWFLVGLFDPSGVGPRLFFQRVPEGKVVKNRVHLDVRVGTGLIGEQRVATLEAECALLVALGAVRVRPLLADDENESCLVTQDIEGNEFCLD